VKIRLSLPVLAQLAGIAWFVAAWEFFFYRLGSGASARYLLLAWAAGLALLAIGGLVLSLLADGCLLAVLFTAAVGASLLAAVFVLSTFPAAQIPTGDPTPSHTHCQTLSGAVNDCPGG